MALRTAGLLGPFSTSEAASWLVLTRQMAVLLLKDIASTPKYAKPNNALNTTSQTSLPDRPRLVITSKCFQRYFHLHAPRPQESLATFWIKAYTQISLLR